ncbi:hypothetical protein BMA10399_E0754 [Burkholderia mallei ATCC 10399]|uniref:Uncharacterized protein n=1 Tax=Burkholderia mallei (strain NCTC 10229) TaxID=412022 RepID=A2S338_BURM9|nr:hypothetical protein BMA10229_A0355 [Burkholderia mallei NCTC 10229]EDP88480.1 hypothetical protein BMA10399_E0754 [Burkholderia mallei ATCC 10399]
MICIFIQYRGKFKRYLKFGAIAAIPPRFGCVEATLRTR